MAWNPNQYLKFGSARLRPALDLLSRTSSMVGDPAQVKSVMDLGCGTGNMAEMLCRAFPNAKVDGLDSSAHMIGRALKDHTNSEFKNRIAFRVGSVENEAQFKSKKYDVVYSNAALHWCTSHAQLFPDLIHSMVNPAGGVLAVQMPDTIDQTSHVLMDTAAFRSGMLDKIRHVRIPRTEHDATWYFNLLSPLVKDVDMWTTEYVQQLPAAAPAAAAAEAHETSAARHPVLEYTKSTGLLPIIEALGGEGTANCQTYLGEYDRLLQEAYPIVRVQNKHLPNGKYITIMPFKRFFMVCKV